MNPGKYLSIFDKLRLWWHGYCLRHLCEKVMTEPSVGRLCPECELELMRARQDAIARIAAKVGKCGICGGDHKDYMVHGAALPTRRLPDSVNTQPSPEYVAEVLAEVKKRVGNEAKVNRTAIAEDLMPLYDQALFGEYVIAVFDHALGYYVPSTIPVTLLDLIQRASI